MILLISKVNRSFEFAAPKVSNNNSTWPLIFSFKNSLKIFFHSLALNFKRNWATYSPHTRPLRAFQLQSTLQNTHECWLPSHTRGNRRIILTAQKLKWKIHGCKRLVLHGFRAWFCYCLPGFPSFTHYIYLSIRPVAALKSFLCFPLKI